MERISVIKGNPDKVPLILIAPHGPDDQYTSEITTEICKKLGCDGIINNGFERADKFDYANEKCDCNNIAHCYEDVVKEEFLDPIEKAVNKIHLNLTEANIFIIHGMADPKQPVDMVIGFGASNTKNPSYTCKLWQKNAFMYILCRNGLTDINAGKAGGKYAGASPNNLNQLYRIHNPDNLVDSMQIEITRNLRVGKADQWQKTASFLANCLNEYLIYLELREKNLTPPKWAPNWEEIAEKLPCF